MATYKWLGFKVTHQFIIVWLSLASFLHNILMNGANNVIISSLQKEFYLSSRETGSYVSIYDVGSLFSAVFIPIISAHGSKPRWISFGMVMLFLGCQVTTLPHFFRTSSISSSDGKTIELCNNSAFSPEITYPYVRAMTQLNTSSLSERIEPAAPTFQFKLKHLLYVGNIINGLSSASMTSLAFSYIEDIAPPHLSAVYESVYYAVGALGMGIGFITTSNCLALHTDFNRPNNVLPDWLTSNHPNWIGAWWLPFIIFGFVALLLALVIFLFPKKIDYVETNSPHKEMSNLDDLKNSSELVKLTNGTQGHATEELDKQSLPEIRGEPEDVKSQNPSSLLNTLEFTGSMLSLKKTGFYASQNMIDERQKNIGSLSSLDEETKSYNSLFNKTLSLFKNPVYIFLLIVQTIEGLLQNSFLAFASLFLEYQYRLSSGTSALIIGFLSLPPLIFGGLLSGYICKKLKNDNIHCFKFITGVLFVNVLVYSGFMLYCEQPVLVTSNNLDTFSSLMQEHGLSSSNPQGCFETNNNCNCDTRNFKPICLSGSKDIYFQSPCLAGCQNYTKTPAIKDFYSVCTQSSCYQYFDNVTENTGRFVDGMCPTNKCTTKLILSYISIFLLMLLNALLFLPYLKVTIGSVNSKEMNTIVLGMKQFCMNAFGTIPGPILFGAVIDTTCNYWHTDSSGQRVCKLYNNELFARRFGIMGMGFKSICLILITACLVISIRKRSLKK